MEEEEKIQIYYEIRKEKRKRFWSKVWNITKLTLNTMAKIVVAISKVVAQISQSIFESFGDKGKNKNGKK